MEIQSNSVNNSVKYLHTKVSNLPFINSTIANQFPLQYFHRKLIRLKYLTITNLPQINLLLIPLNFIVPKYPPKITTPKLP